jgi:hypothetical protein
MTIKEALERLLAEKLPVQVVVGKVISVDKSSMTCDIDLQTAPNMIGVRLRSVIDGKEQGILVVPKIGSNVLVGLIDNRKQSAFVIGFGEVENVRVLCDDIELAGNSFGGLVKVEELKSQLNKTNQLLQSILGIFNGAPIPEPGNGSPSALQAALKGAVTGKVLGDFNNLENKKVKHGG